MKTDWLSDVGDKIRADCERWKHHKNFYLTKAKEWPKSTPKFVQCYFCCDWMWIFGRHERLGWKNSRNSEQIEVAILLMISISFFKFDILQLYILNLAPPKWRTVFTRNSHLIRKWTLFDLNHRHIPLIKWIIYIADEIHMNRILLWSKCYRNKDGYVRCNTP